MPWRLWRAWLVLVKVLWYGGTQPSARQCAGRRANLYNLALDGMEGIELPGMNMALPGLGGSIGGGVALTAVGVILLVNTRFGITLDWIEEWWLVAPILVGAYLLTKALQERKAAASHDEPYPATDYPGEPFGS